MKSVHTNTASPRCPHCHSQDVTPISERSLILAGVGGLLGCVIMALLALSGRPKNKTGAVGLIVFGAFSGASVGLSFGKPVSDDSVRQEYLCLSCLHVFTHYKHSVS